MGQERVVLGWAENKKKEKKKRRENPCLPPTLMKETLALYRITNVTSSVRLLLQCLSLDPLSQMQNRHLLLKAKSSP